MSNHGAEERLVLFAASIARALRYLMRHGDLLEPAFSLAFVGRPLFVVFFWNGNGFSLAVRL
jgi:hypothetical protein